MSTKKKKPKLELNQELRFFQKNKPKYLKTYEGQYVLIHDNEFLGSYTTEQEAYEAGLKMIGNKPFLIKMVAEKEPIESAPAVTLGLMFAHVL